MIRDGGWAQVRSPYYLPGYWQQWPGLQLAKIGRDNWVCIFIIGMKVNWTLILLVSVLCKVYLSWSLKSWGKNDERDHNRTQVFKFPVLKFTNDKLHVSWYIDISMYISFFPPLSVLLLHCQLESSMKKASEIHCSVFYILLVYFPICCQIFCDS